MRLPRRSNIRSRFALLIALLALYALMSCTRTSEPQLDVTPLSTQLVTGETVQLIVTRRFPAGPLETVTDRVTYSSSNLDIATISDKGVVLAGGTAGSVVVHAFDPLSDAVGSVGVTVSVPRIESIEVEPSTATVLRPGTQRQFNATAHLNNGLLRDVTSQVTWASSNEAAAMVGRTTVDFGVVFGIREGDTTISATDPATLVQGRTIVFVRGEIPELRAIVVTPDPGSVNVGATLQLTALGVYSDGTTNDVTKSVVWSSSDSTVLTIGATGLATGALAGSATVTATGTRTPAGIGDAGAAADGGADAVVRGSAVVTVR
jgi:hypothetical protein